MIVNVKLYGSLQKESQDYNPETGMEVEMPNGSTMGELV